RYGRQREVCHRKVTADFDITLDPTSKSGLATLASAADARTQSLCKTRLGGRGRSDDGPCAANRHVSQHRIAAGQQFERLGNQLTEIERPGGPCLVRVEPGR